MALDLAHAHSACIHADNAVVEARQVALVFTNELWLECCLPVARNVQAQFAVGRDNGLGTEAIPMVPGSALAGLVTEVVSQAGSYSGLPEYLGQCDGRNK